MGCRSVKQRRVAKQMSAALEPLGGEVSTRRLGVSRTTVIKEVNSEAAAVPAGRVL